MSRPSRNQRDHHISHLGCCFYDSCRKTFIVCNAAGLKGWILSSLYQYTVGLPGRVPIHRNTYFISNSVSKQSNKQSNVYMNVRHSHQLQSSMVMTLLGRVNVCYWYFLYLEFPVAQPIGVLRRLSWRFPQRPMGEACR